MKAEASGASPNSAVKIGIGKAESHDQHDFRGLAAQETMAEAAIWMLAAAFLTFLVTSIGTWLIWRQVKLTRQAVEDTNEAIKVAQEANEIARVSADAQLRPYLYIEKIEPLYLTKETEAIAVRLRNFGQTPAENVRVKATSRRCKKGEVITAIPNLDEASISRDIPPQHTQTTLIPVNFDDWPGTVGAINAQEIVLVINLRYGYTGLGGQHFFPPTSVIVFDHKGPRQPHAKDNLK